MLAPRERERISAVAMSWCTNLGKEGRSPHPARHDAVWLVRVATDGLVRFFTTSGRPHGGCHWPGSGASGEEREEFFTLVFRLLTPGFLFSSSIQLR